MNAGLYVCSKHKVSPWQGAEALGEESGIEEVSPARKSVTQARKGGVGEEDGDKHRRGERVGISIPRPGPPFSSVEQLTCLGRTSPA